MGLQALQLVSRPISSSQCLQTATEVPSFTRNGFPQPRKQGEKFSVQIQAFSLLKSIEGSIPTAYSEDSSRVKREGPLLCSKSCRIGSSEFGGVRCMGVGSLKGGGNRFAERGLHLPSAKSEQDGREKFLESVKQDAAKQISDTEEPFRDSVESGQTIGGATSELQFGMQDGKSRDGEETTTLTDHDGDNPHAEIANEVWSAKELDGTNPFLDDSDKVEVHGEENEAVY